MSVAPNILGGGSSIINAAPSLLDNGRALTAGIRGRTGMSANSRALLEGFYNNATALFNQLYTKTENGELYNTTAILALRSKYDYLVSDEVKAGTAASSSNDTSVSSSSTTGTNVDTQA